MKIVNMPQLFHVVCCYDCQTFQVQQVKKNPKWACKMCGAKQSLKKVYGQGSGFDCRKFVQSLNFQKMNTSSDNITVPEASSSYEHEISVPEEVVVQSGLKSNPSMWSKFLDGDIKGGRNDAESDDDVRVTTERDVILKEAREMEKSQRQEFKAGKRKRQLKPYTVTENEKQIPVADNYSSKFIPRKRKRYKGIQQNDFDIESCSSARQCMTDIQQVIDRSQATYRSDEKVNENQMPILSSRNLAEVALMPNKHIKRDEAILDSSNRPAKLMSRKWSKFLDINPEDTFSEDDLENVKESSVNVEKSSQCRVVFDTCNNTSLCKFDQGFKENCDIGGSNNNFNLNIDIDEVFDDW